MTLGNTDAQECQMALGSRVSDSVGKAAFISQEICHCGIST